MSYLDRLKLKILANAPEYEATKGTKAPYVPFVAPESAPFRQISAADLPIDPEGDARRQRVLAMLDERPDTRYAVLVDDPYTDPVLLTLAIRGRATCELKIQAAQFDPFELLAMLDRHGAKVH